MTSIMRDRYNESQSRSDISRSGQPTQNPYLTKLGNAVMPPHTCFCTKLAVKVGRLIESFYQKLFRLVYQDPLMLNLSNFWPLTMQL